MSDYTDDLLRALVRTTARAVFPVRQVYEVVNVGGKGARQMKAFNLADGTRTQSDIAKQANIDQGNFSRTVSRWVEAGIMFRLGEGREAKLLHVYPLPTKLPKE